MKPFAPFLVRAIERHRAEILGLLGGEPVPAEVGQRYANDTGQMMNGFFLMLIESLEERGRAIRDDHTTTLIPGLRDAGFPLAAVMTGTIRLFVGMAGKLVHTLPDEHRDAAADWFANFSSEYAGEILRAWEGE